MVLGRLSGDESVLKIQFPVLERNGDCVEAYPVVVQSFHGCEKLLCELWIH